MKIPLPKIPLGITTAITTPHDLEPEARFSRVILRGFDAPGITAQNMQFDEVALDRLMLVNAAWDNVLMMDIEIRGCDFSAAVLSAGGLHRVRFSDCRLAGIDFSRSTIKDVTFTGCRLDMANFRFAKLKNIRFEDCTLIETDFQVGELHNVTFEGCVIERAIFDQCKVYGVDARGSELREIHGWQYLQGLTIDHLQLIEIAPELARALGLRVQ